MFYICHLGKSICLIFIYTEISLNVYCKISVAMEVHCSDLPSRKNLFSVARNAVSWQPPRHFYHLQLQHFYHLPQCSNWGCFLLGEHSGCTLKSGHFHLTGVSSMGNLYTKAGQDFLRVVRKPRAFSTESYFLPSLILPMPDPHHGLKALPAFVFPSPLCLLLWALLSITSCTSNTS